VEFDPSNFNPFDANFVKESAAYDKPNSSRKVMTVKKTKK
jgi:hypothetical protein